MAGGIDTNDPFKVWERNEPFNENTSNADQLTTDVRGHYKSHLALDWETRNIDKVGTFIDLLFIIIDVIYF